MRISRIVCTLLAGGLLTGCAAQHPAVTGTWVTPPDAPPGRNPIARVSFVHEGTFTAAASYEGKGEKSISGKYYYSGGTALKGRLRLVYQASPTQTREYDVEIRGDEMVLGEKQAVMLRLK
jgi:hypothetical protein